MKLIKQYIYSLIFFILILFVITVSNVSADMVGTSKIGAKGPSHNIVVTYFHNTFRCPTCHRIEELSSQAVNLNFEDEMKSGKVVWRVINVDEPEKKHYIKDYQLYTKSLIISEMRGGKEVRWKNLEKVWTFVRSKEKFDKYVKTEIKEWLKE